LQSQLDALEPLGDEERGFVVDVSEDAETIVDAVLVSATGACDAP
jgi:gluconokinase